MPSKEKMNAWDARRREIKLDGNKIVEVFTVQTKATQEQGKPKAFVLEFYGNGGRSERIASWSAHHFWDDKPIELWMPNYPGYGGSTGPAKLDSIPPAALATYAAMLKEAGNRPIILSGNSMGCATALYVASKRECDAIILRNPPPLQKLILGHYGWWNLWLFAGPVSLSIPAELNAMLTAPQVRVPAVFVMTEQDAVVPYIYQQLVYNLYAGPKELLRITHGGHNTGYSPDSDEAYRKKIDNLWSRVFQLNSH